MTQTNHMLNKIFLQKAVLVGVFSAASLLPLTYLAIEDIKAGKKIANVELLLLAVATPIFCAKAFSEIRDYKNSKMFSVLVTRKYLKETAKNQPDFKMFDQILANQESMKNISVFIYNSLRSSEQKILKNIVSEMRSEMHNSVKYDDLSKEEESVLLKKMFLDARKRIIKLIQEHAALHPEFVQELYKTVAYEHMLHRIQNIQKTNQQRIK